MDIRRDGYVRVVVSEGHFKPQTVVTASRLRRFHIGWRARNLSIAKAAFRAEQVDRTLRLPGV